MRQLAILIFALAVAACSQQEQSAPPRIMTSAHSEASWLVTCNSAEAQGAALCTEQQVVWAVIYRTEQDAQHFTARLGQDTQGQDVHVALTAPIPRTGDNLRGTIVFVRGLASAARGEGGAISVLLREAELLGVQTLVDGPRQGPFAPELTLAEFGRHCIDDSDDLTFAERCAGRRVLWYAIFEGPLPNGNQVLRLPFNNNRFAAQLEMTEPLDWQVHFPELGGQLVVFEGVVGDAINREQRIDFVPIHDAHIISFPRVPLTVVDITGVE